MTDLKCKIVEVCIFTKKDDEPRYLLLKRSGSDAIYPDIWQFVTGGIHDNEKAFRAAHRELSEETKLIAERFYTVPHVSVFYDAGYDAVNLSPLFAAEVRASPDPELSEEHVGFRWCTYEQAHEMLVWPGQKQGLTIVHRYIVGETEAGQLLDITRMIRSTGTAPDTPIRK